MKRQGRLLLGLIMAAIFCVIVAGSLTLSFWEGGSLASLLASPTAALNYNTPTVSPTPVAPTLEPTLMQLPTLTPTYTPPPNCPPPPGALAVEVRLGDTLESLAATYGIAVQDLMQANCMLVTTLQPGMIVYIPQPATTAVVVSWPTATPYVCGVPWGWVPYTVRPGDTLSSLSRAYGVTVFDLQKANCLGTTTLIYTGQVLYVPNVPTVTPYPTAILWTATPVWTVTPIYPSATFIYPTPTEAATFTPAPTATFIYPTPTEAIPPSATPAPTDVPPPPTATPEFLYPTPTYP
jgi:LysM repeat protein